MKSNDNVVKKVSIKDLIKSLTMVQEEGFKYVDLVTRSTEGSDYVGIIPHEEYKEEIIVIEFDMKYLNQMI